MWPLPLMDLPRRFMSSSQARMGCAAVLYGILLNCGALLGQDANLPDPFEFLAVQPAEQAMPPTVRPPQAQAPVPLPAQVAHEPTPEVDTTSLPETTDSLLGTADRQPDAAPPAEQPDRDPILQQPFERALLIDVSGPIFDRFHWYLNHRLDLAHEQQCDLVIVRLTSPGGDLEHSLQLARRLRDIKWATTVAFIPEEAISGGAIIALGCDRIYMQSGALLGDAGPIRMGLGGQFEHAEEKVVSYTVTAVREVAESQQRPGAVVEAMVDRSVTVYQATNKQTGEVVYVTDKELDAAGAAERFDLGAAVPETGQNRFLTVAAGRAMELELCEGVFASEEDWLPQMSIERLEVTRMTWVDQTVFILNRPWLTALLLIVGLIGLYLELAAPGISFAGLGSVLCFGLFFWSHFLGGTSGWLEVLLFVLGVGCLAMELFVLPGFGLFGLTGLSLVIVSLVMASQDFVVPTGPAQWRELQVNVLVVLGAVLGVMVLFFAQILLLDSIPGLNRFRLSAPEGHWSSTQDQLSGGLLQSATFASAAPEIGARGVAESDLRPSGKVLLQDRLRDVITEGDYVEAGSAVEVLRVEGNRIIVRKV